MRAFEEASRRGLLTIGFAGYEGGALARSDSIAHLLVVRSDSIHRIQETQDALVLQLWSTIQDSMRERVAS
jgi:D-sedoheptulose 7-phosphate isomerase